MDFGKRHRSPGFRDDSGMMTAQLTRFRHTARVRDDAHFMHDIAGVIRHAHGLKLRIETALQLWIVRRYTRGACIFVAT